MAERRRRRRKPRGGRISQSEYLDWLYKIGTGWIGWTEEQTLNSTLAGIEDAYHGRMGMLQAIFGSAEDKPIVEKTGKRPGLIAQLAEIQKQEKARMKKKGAR